MADEEETNEYRWESGYEKTWQVLRDLNKTMKSNNEDGIHFVF
jgi:hypothetical protein